jgi:hypothetical protein
MTEEKYPFFFSDAGEKVGSRSAFGVSNMAGILFFFRGVLIISLITSTRGEVAGSGSVLNFFLAGFGARR